MSDVFSDEIVDCVDELLRKKGQYFVNVHIRVLRLKVMIFP